MKLGGEHEVYYLRVIARGYRYCTAGPFALEVGPQPRDFVLERGEISRGVVLHETRGVVRLADARALADARFYAAERSSRYFVRSHRQGTYDLSFQLFQPSATVLKTFQVPVLEGGQSDRPIDLGELSLGPPSSRGGPTPGCIAACDVVNGDGDARATPTDAIYPLRFLFLGGAPPPPPYPACDFSEQVSDRELGCETPCP